MNHTVIYLFVSDLLHTTYFFEIRKWLFCVTTMILFMDLDSVFHCMKEPHLFMYSLVDGHLVCFQCGSSGLGLL